MLSKEKIQSMYDAAVRCEFARNNSDDDDEDQDSSYALCCELEGVGGLSATIRKLIDKVRAADIELLSLREQLAEKEERLFRLRTSLEIEMKGHEAAERQLAELKALDPVGYVGNSDLYALSTGDLGCIAPYNAFEGIPLFTAAKPAED